VAAALLAIISVATWLGFGANRGWTKTTRTRMEKDPTLDNMQVAIVEKHFSPGIDALGAGLLISSALAGISFAFNPKLRH